MAQMKHFFQNTSQCWQFFSLSAQINLQKFSEHHAWRRTGALGQVDQAEGDHEDGCRLNVGSHVFEVLNAFGCALLAEVCVVDLPEGEHAFISHKAAEMRIIHK